MTNAFVHPEFLVETGWLASHLEDSSVRILDCTTHLSALPDNSYYVESGAAKPRAGAHFEPLPARRDMVATRNDVLAAIGDDAICTVNALRPEQHAGTGGVYYGRRGHIQGSVNLAPAATVDDDNAYKSAAELRRMFAGPLSKPAVITYCGGGIAATADTLVLTMLGQDNVRVYDASLSEWARDPALPMET